MRPLPCCMGKNEKDAAKCFYASFASKSRESYKIMEYRINLSDITTKEEFHKRIEEMLPCPSWYGRNLDALYDLLTEQREERKLVFMGCGPFTQDMPGYMRALKALCAKAQEENPSLTVVFMECSPAS